MLHSVSRRRSISGTASLDTLIATGLAFLALLSFVALGTSFRASIVEPTRSPGVVQARPAMPSLESRATAGVRPIIALVDGFSSSQRLFGFSGTVVDGLRAMGHDARRIDVGPYASSATNATVLRQVFAELAKEGRPIHAIAHSKGGVDLLAATAEPLEAVQSVTTIASPHRGTALVGAVGVLLRTPLLGKALAALVNRPLHFIQRVGLGNTTGLRADIRGVVAGMVAHDGASIRINPSLQYRTVAGYSGDVAKYRRAYQSEFGPILNPSRTRHWINRLTSKLMSGPEDGVVTLSSSLLPDGPNVKHLGTFNGDHLRQVSDPQVIDVIADHVLPSLHGADQ